MTDLADYAEERVLNHLFNSGAANQLTRPTSTQVSLHDGDPGEAGSANEVSTGDWSNYARVTVNNDGTTGTYWNAAAANAGGFRCTNNGEIDFGTATIVTPVTVTHVVVRDHSGNALYVGALTASKQVTNGDPVKFLDAALALSLT